MKVARFVLKIVAISLAAAALVCAAVAYWDKLAEACGCAKGKLKRSACYSRPSAEVTELYVCPGCRRQGVARQLLEAFLDACRQEGVEAVTVLTGEDNAPAQALYQKMGFSPSGEAHFEQGL